MNVANTFPTLLEAFFMDRLVRQRQVSPHTVGLHLTARQRFMDFQSIS